MDSRPGHKYNKKLKAELKKYGITYKMLSNVSGYAEHTIEIYMSAPLSEWHEEIFKDSIARILKNGIPHSGRDIKDTLKKEHIRVSELSREMGIPYCNLRYWLSSAKKPMSEQRRTEIENAINKIREERRLNYESV